MYLRVVGNETRDWIHVAVKYSNEPLSSTEDGEYLDQLSDC